MAVYAIGDIQGCYSALRGLLDKLNFNPVRDRLWLVGDIVNRGGESLASLRFVKSLGDAAVAVLGNHDLHLLAAAEGERRPEPGSDLWPILEAPDRDELIDWLRRRPLLHHDAALGYTMVHAGLLPQWNLDQARALAQEVEAALRSDTYPELIRRMYGNEPDHWSDALSGWDRLRVIINGLVRLRYCDAEGHMTMKHKGPPEEAPAGLVAWFDAPGRKSAHLNIVFGHWSALGYRRRPGVIALDSGCVWGGALTAVRLDDRTAAAEQWTCMKAGR